MGAALLEQPECGIEYQESGDDRSLDIFAEHQFEHDRSFEHPRNRRPELFDCHAQRMKRRIGHCVWAEFLQPTARFVACQAARQIILRGSCRFGGQSTFQGRRRNNGHDLPCAGQLVAVHQRWAALCVVLKRAPLTCPLVEPCPKLPQVREMHSRRRPWRSSSLWPQRSAAHVTQCRPWSRPSADLSRLRCLPLSP